MCPQLHTILIPHPKLNFIIPTLAQKNYFYIFLYIYPFARNWIPTLFNTLSQLHIVVPESHLTHSNLKFLFPHVTSFLNVLCQCVISSLDST
ncbi:hypothetical protein TpMuguga_04g00262 [Theileria parva strain Muguga]|uniref:Uncharacterized protein n=1 Tax=Theileria parva TaxID=5875 RepID=Q4N2T4_THEPA|nr:uncharacterized protein TpMuguga_04g00262 [Theileria parva strain Muguga]EAN31614.1 hypothetical protein TpMuguga_04g00262 [Theileria parva strain Muguga]|eukprot:XP_763897.1 hypothetical protein [Theileria parva strain Muguga]